MIQKDALCNQMHRFILSINAAVGALAATAMSPACPVALTVYFTGARVEVQCSLRAWVYGRGVSDPSSRLRWRAALLSKCALRSQRALLQQLWVLLRFRK